MFYRQHLPSPQVGMNQYLSFMFAAGKKWSSMQNIQAVKHDHELYYSKKTIAWHFHLQILDFLKLLRFRH